MLPDGAERHLEDWTIFFLNQTPFNTISPVLALETSESADDLSTNPDGHPGLIYVLNLVRTKHDKTARRCVRVRTNHDPERVSLTRSQRCRRQSDGHLHAPSVHPDLQGEYRRGVSVFQSSDTSAHAHACQQPVLLLALDDYFAHPSQDCLARLFDAINSMDVTGAPELTRYEKLVMRASERKDIFGEKFASPRIPDHMPNLSGSHAKPQHKTTSSTGSHSSEDGILIRRPPQAQAQTQTQGEGTRERSATESSGASSHPNPSSPSDSSFSLGGSAVWVGDESAILDNQVGVAIGGGPGSVTSGTQTSRGRRSTDASSASSNGFVRDQGAYNGAIPTASDPHLRSGLSKDTHFFQTTIAYKGHQLPIKLPLATFPEEVGDVSP